MVELFLDRFEDDLAVLIYESREIVMPRALLPKDAKEGEVLKLSLARDPEATRRAQERAGKLRQKLGDSDDGGDVTL